jgi:hypothetical protein
MCDKNIKINHREVSCEAADWVQLAYERTQPRTFLNTLMDLESIKLLLFLTS